MLSKSTQRNLAVYLAAMIFLHAFVAWKSRHGVAEGLPDFSIFYTAAQILHQGHAARLYDNNLQEDVQGAFSSAAIRKRGSILPFNHPPFEALLFVPLASFSYLTAYFIWLGINFCLLAGAVVILRNNLPVLGRAPVYLWALACLGFFPVFVALVQGQDSILALFCYCMAFASLRRGAELRAGSWLGLVLFKFNLVVPFVCPPLLAKRKRLITGFLAAALPLGVIGLASVGWNACKNYPAYLWGTERNQSYLWNRSLGNMANLRGIVSSLVPSNTPRLRDGLVILLSVALVLVVTPVWKSRSQPLFFQLVIASTVLLTLLLSYHIYTHDLSLLLLANVLICEFLLSDALVRNWVKKAIYACIAILWCSPVYLVLSLRYKQLQLVGIVMMVLFFLLTKVCFDRSTWRESPET